MELGLAQRRAILASQVSKWSKATKQEKSEILDAICQVTGWHRDHTRKMIRQGVAGITPKSMGIAAANMMRSTKPGGYSVPAWICSDHDRSSDSTTCSPAMITLRAR